MKKTRIVRTLFSVSGLILLGKLIGFVKQMVVASAFGATIETDLINLSHGFIGNLQYLLVQCSVTSVVSIYIHMGSKREEDARRFAGDAVRALAIISAGAVLLVLGGASWLSKLLAPSYAPEVSARLTFYIRLFAPTLLLFAVGAIFHALLDANKRFLPGSCSSLIQSLAVIAAVLLFRSLLGTDALALGFWLYAVCNALFLWVCARRHMGAASGNPFRNPAVGQLMRMSLPLLLGYSVVYVNQMVDKMLASGLETGSVTALSYGAVLSNLVGTFIASFCSILFSYITTKIAAGEHRGAAALALRTLTLLVAAFLPVSILTVLCAKDIVTIAFGRGAFGADSVAITARALMGYGLMFVPLAFRELFSRFQYSYQDTRRPMVNSTIGIVINIALSIALCPRFGVLGISFATSVSVAVCALLNVLSSRRHNRDLRFRPLLRQLAYLAVGGVVCGLAARWCGSVLQESAPILRFAVTTLLSGGVYLAVIAPLLLRLLRREKGS